MTTLRAIVVDDESNSREILSALLLKHCPQVHVFAEAASADAAREIVDQDEPDLMFLDAKMPGRSGFDLLDSFAERNFAVIFVSAYSNYALRAIKAAAFDYLLKPVDYRELQAAVNRLLHPATSWYQGPASLKERAARLQVYQSNIRSGNRLNRIAIPHARGLRVVSLDDIVYLQSESACTWVYLSNGERVLATGLLREYEDMLSPGPFVRIHRSYIINFDHLQEYRYDKGSQVVMSNGVLLPISRMRLHAFQESLHGILHNGSGQDI